MDDNDSSQEIQTPTKSNKINLSIDLRLVVLVLLLVIGGMLFAWKPWQGSGINESSRTVSITGEAKVTAEPDEYVFSPGYEFKNSVKATALAELTTKNDEVTKKLKELGVADSKIKSDSDGYNYDFYYDQSSGQNIYSLRLTVTVGNKALAQKVQDYLLTTDPTGAVSPQADFSDAKRKQLEAKARDEATKDARSKADQSAKNLGYKIGKVKSVKDDNGFEDNQRIYIGANSVSQSAGSEDKSLSINQGENDLTYSVTVVYYLK